MRNDIAGPETESTTAMWEGLEGVVREKAQEFIQQILEEEVTELLGREKSERKAAVDAAPGYRNGYGKARRLSMSSGTNHGATHPGYGVWRNASRVGSCRCLRDGRRR